VFIALSLCYPDLASFTRLTNIGEFTVQTSYVLYVAWGAQRELTRPSTHRSDRKFSEPGPDSRTGGQSNLSCQRFEASGKALEIAPARVKSCSG
jgi:hypothetical protein